MSARPESGILTCAAAAWGCTMEELFGELRAGHVVRARRLAMALVRELTPLSYAAIGVLFGRDHGAVMHHCEQMRQRVQATPPPEATQRERTLWKDEADVFRQLRDRFTEALRY